MRIELKRLDVQRAKKFQLAMLFVLQMLLVLDNPTYSVFRHFCYVKFYIKIYLRSVVGIWFILMLNRDSAAKVTFLQLYDKRVGSVRVALSSTNYIY